MADAGRPGVSSPVTVGREPELEIFRRAIDDVRAGRPRVVVVGGEAGIGKSRLVAGGGLPRRRRPGRARQLSGTRLLDPVPAVRGDAAGRRPGDARGLGRRGARARTSRPGRDHAGTGQCGHVGRPVTAGAAQRTTTSTGSGCTRRSSGSPRVSRDWGRRCSCSRTCNGSIQPASSCCRSLRTTCAGARRCSCSRFVPGHSTVAARSLSFLADLSRGDNVERLELGPLDADATRLQVAAILGGQPSADWWIASSVWVTAIRCTRGAAGGGAS